VKSAGKGFVLGAANVLLIAIGIAMMERSGEAVILVTMFGMIPGVIAGTVLGVIAQHMPSHNVGARIAALTLPSVLLVIVLGTVFGMEELIPVASIPSVVAALVLERWTRVVEPPPVPVAQIHA
jgi:ABC-type dipeptide/oligopeptide/nickel transport system permease subunit